MGAISAPAIGIVTALEEEAECLAVLEGASGIRVRCGGVGPQRATIAAGALLADGCRAMVSFGIAGGLDPRLRPGTLVLAQEIATADGKRHAVDPAWRNGLRARLEGRLVTAAGLMIGSDRVIMTPADKAALHQATGAIAVDMESHAIAAAAEAARIPFLIVRAVSDPASGVVPPSALGGVSPEGRRQVAKVLAKLLRRPGDLPALIGLARAGRTGRRTLVRAAALAGPDFGIGRG